MENATPTSHNQQRNERSVDDLANQAPDRDGTRSAECKQDPIHGEGTGEQDDADYRDHPLDLAIRGKQGCAGNEADVQDDREYALQEKRLSDYGADRLSVLSDIAHSQIVDAQAANRLK